MIYPIFGKTINGTTDSVGIINVLSVFKLQDQMANFLRLKGSPAGKMKMRSE